MVQRKRAVIPSSKYLFVHSGCLLLDCALGGDQPAGWPLGRVINVVGDKSSAKTGLAAEALINFCKQYPDGGAAYRDFEHAFDKDYAANNGAPIEKIDFGDEDDPLLTVEDFAHDFEAFCDQQAKANTPGIYVVDSLDAISDEAEMKASLEKGTYGTAKAKQLSTMFRKLTWKVEQSNVLLFVISQIRDAIGVTFGEKKKRAGGHALDFYAAQIVWLAHIGILTETIGKIKRPYGIMVKAKVKKNKIGKPFGEAVFPVEFNYGINDVEASLKWLEEIGYSKEDNSTLGNLSSFRKALDKANNADYKTLVQDLNTYVSEKWVEIESRFLPKRKKYAD